MLRFVHSNRLDALAERLAAVLATAPLAPLATEIIVVPSAGVGRWLGFELANRLGIAAGLRYPFPAAYVWELFATVLPTLPRASPFDPAVLTWRLMRLLAKPRRDAVFAPVARYLERGTATARYELAAALAERFDAYAAYRPRWLEGWLAGKAFQLGEHEAWQAALWRELAAEQVTIPHAHPSHAFFERLRDDPSTRSLLPPRLALFGVEALAPLYLDIFQGLARFIEVTVYLPSPSREYWPDIATRAERSRAARRDPEYAEHRDVGHRLLAALGAHGRAFFDQLAALDSEDIACYVTPSGEHLLARLQRDVLELTESPSAPLAESDHSITIHACHGAVREAEVLHDQLLARFEADPTLAPEDVLILVPEIDRYAAAFDAVFSSVPRERMIPFSIADRAAAAERPLVRSVLALIEVGLGRLDAQSVLALLDEPRLARRFGLDASDLPRLRRWIDETGIRWGEDERAKRRLDLPPSRAFTWRAGLDRMILGAAMAPGAARGGLAALGGIVPFEDVEGAGMARVGALDRFLDALAELAEDFTQARPIGKWCERVAALLDAFHVIDPIDAEDAASVRDALNDVARAAALAAGTEGNASAEPLPASLARRPIEAALTSLARGGQFLGGGVTIARLALGRVIPARIVCVAGLNDGVFPAADRERGFDLMRGARAPGDRSRREEDRYAFLCAVLAARDAFIATYTGQSARDTAQLPPSMVLATLIETLREMLPHEAPDRASDRLIVRHPLHAASPRYGGPEPALFTYAAEWRASATPPSPRPFAAALRLPPAAVVDTAERVIELSVLERFVVEPARHTLREALGVKLYELDDRVDSVEPFTLEQLEGYVVRDALLEAIVQGEPIESAWQRLASEGRLPEGRVGAALLERERDSARSIALAATHALGIAEPGTATIAFTRPLAVDLAVSTASMPDLRLRGRLDHLTNAGQLVLRAGQLSASAMLVAWVRHLALNAAETLGASARRTFLIGRQDKAGGRDGPSTVAFNAMTAEQASTCLADLLALLADAERAFVPFYPEAARAYIAASRTGKPALKAAAEAWAPATFGGRTPESERPYTALAIRDDPAPLDAAFEALARRVFEPIARHSDAFPPKNGGHA